MINREEAKKKSIMCSNKSMCCEQLVEDIYDSIGSCGECEYYLDGYCLTTHDKHEAEFFCADFKRKEQ